MIGGRICRFSIDFTEMRTRIEEIDEQLQRADRPEERFELLCDLALELIGVDLSRAIATAEEARELLERIGRPPTGRLFDLLGEAYARSGRYDEGIAVMEQAIPLLEAEGELRRAMVVNTNIGNTDWMAGRLDEAGERFRSSRAKAIELADRRHQMFVTNNIGTLLLSMEQYEEAERELLEALPIAEEIDDEVMRGSILQNLGRLRCEQLDFAGGLAALQQSLNIFSDLDHAPGIASVSVVIGKIHSQLGNRSAALEAYGRSLETARRLGDRWSESAALNNIGDIYSTEERFAEAEDHFRAALAIKREIGNRSQIASTLLNRAAIALEQDDAAAAVPLFDEAVGIGREEQSRETVVRGLLGMVRCSMRAGDIDSERGTISTSTEEIRAELEAMRGRDIWPELRFELARIAIDLDDVVQARSDLEEILPVAVQSGRESLAAAIHTLLADACRRLGAVEEAYDHLLEGQQIERGRLRRTADQRLESVMAITEVNRLRSERELARRRSEILRLEKEQLEKDLEHRKRELLSSAMFLSQKNAFLRTLRRRIERLDDEKESSGTEDLRSISAEIAEVVGTEDSWSSFEQEFRAVHGDYLQVLSADYPKLTPTELKVCALIRTGLSTKEIARILVAEPRSIDKYRQRIRKKIGLDSSENLALVLEGVGRTSG